MVCYAKFAWIGVPLGLQALVVFNDGNIFIYNTSNIINLGHIMKVKLLKKIRKLVK